MTASTLYKKFKELFPVLASDSEYYRLARGNKLIIGRASVRPNPVYTFIYRSDTDWELRCGKEEK